MKNQVKTYIAYFLILCVTVSIVPLNLIHHHESFEIVCAELDPTEENNPCHQTLYHSASFDDALCEHTTHLKKEVEDCEFCELLTTRHSFYLPMTIEWLNPPFVLDGKSELVVKFIPGFTHQVVSNRGPPA